MSAKLYEHERLYQANRDAAVDLYDALERIRKLALSGEGPTFDLILSAADAALAKARGEPA